MTGIGVHDLSVSLGGVTVLDGIDRTFSSGRLIGLVGPNGAGKTTLIRTINGFLTPERGHVTVDGEEVTALSTRELGRRVATVPQATELSFDFDVRTVVEMGRHPYRSRIGGRDPDPDAVDRALARTETARFADRPLSAVSGGERKRVLLARALAQDTPILLLDEPTANLDIGHAARTIELVRDLAVDGDRTVLAAIHDLDLAARYCDRLVLLADGRLRATGAPAEVLTAATVGEAFDTPVSVVNHPETGTPIVTALPRHRGPATDSAGTWSRGSGNVDPDQSDTDQ